jgi:hypothetical protein
MGAGQSERTTGGVNREAAPVTNPEAAPPATLPEATDDAPTEAAIPTAAAAYQLNWYSVNSGGAINAASTNYRMGVSVGQSVAGEASSTNYDLGIGYWYGVSGGGGSTCLIDVAGDVNLDSVVTASDIISLVNFVFKGGAVPQPCEANGDVNCSGSVTAADIIHEVNYVFKAGSPPCDICNDAGAMPCVP